MFATIDTASQTYIDPVTGQRRSAKDGSIVGTPTAPTPEQVAARTTSANSTGSTIANSTVRRFTATPGTPSYTSEADRLIGGLNTAQPTEADATRIREEQLSAVQRQLDAIDQNTASMLSAEAGNATERLGRGRAINARSGVLGSDMGERRTGDIEKVNMQNRNAIIASQEAQKVAILDKAAQRAADILAQEKDRALQNTETYLNYLASKQQEARADIKTLAGSGIQLGQLDDQQYGTLLQQSGYGSPFLFEAVYNAQLPNNEKQDFEYINLGGGKVVRFNKGGGEPEYFDYSMPDGFQFKMAGDIPVFVNESTQEVKLAAPNGGDLSSAAQYAKETELDTYTDASGNRVSVMYNPVSKKTRSIVLGKAKDTNGDGSGYPTGFKPQGFEVSAVSSFIADEGRRQGQSTQDIDAAIKRAQQDPSFFYSTLSVITNDESYSSKYYKPVTLGIPASIVQ